MVSCARACLGHTTTIIILSVFVCTSAPAGNVRLTDFGLSKENITALDSGAFTFCGTPEYLGALPCSGRHVLSPPLGPPP